MGITESVARSFGLFHLELKGKHCLIIEYHSELLFVQLLSSMDIKARSRHRRKKLKEARVQ